jgi:hypothetical protein
MMMTQTNVIHTGNLRDGRSDFWNTTPQFNGELTKKGIIECDKDGGTTYTPIQKKPMMRN